MQFIKRINKRILFLLIILAVFSVCTFADDTGSSGPKNASGVNEENVNTEQAPAVQTQGMTTQAVPQAPSNPATQSNRFGISEYQKSFQSNPNDGVNITSGSLVAKQVDLVLPGKNGLDLIIARDYNSRSFSSSASILTASNKQLIDLINKHENKPSQIVDIEESDRKSDNFGGWIGHGWEFNFGPILKATNYFVSNDSSPYPNQIEVQIDGATTRFIDKKDGKYLPIEPGVHDYILKTDKGYSFIRKNGVKYIFEKSFFDRSRGYFSDDFPDQWEVTNYYYLSRMVDPIGNSITFNYTDYGASITGTESKRIEKEKPMNYFDHAQFNRYFSAGIATGIAGGVIAAGGSAGFALTGNAVGFVLSSVTSWSGAAWLAVGGVVGAVVGAVIGDIVQQNENRHYTYHDRMVYNAHPCRLTSIVDSYNRELDILYDSSDTDDSRIKSIKYLDSNGRPVQIDYSYSIDGTLTGVALPAGNPTHFSYSNLNSGQPNGFDDKGPLMTAIKYPSGATVDYKYRWYDPKYEGIVTIEGLTDDNEKDFSFYVVTDRIINSADSWLYDYSGGSIYSIQLLGGDSSKVWSFGTITETNPLGGINEYTLGYGLILKQINAEGHTTENTWDVLTRNLISSKTIKDGATTLTEYLNYDEYGNPGSVKESGLLNDPFDDRETHYEYMHQKSGTYKDEHIVDRVSHQWVSRGGEVKGEIYYDYDPSGTGLLNSKREMTDSGTAVTNYSYDQSGNMISMTDPRGNTTQYGYNSGSPLPTSTSINAGGKLLNLARTYSQFTGALLSESDYNGNTSRYSYDSIGRVTKKTNADGTSISYTYNDMSNTIDIRDEKDEETTYVYDNQGRLTEVRQPENVTTRYTYNPLSKITSVRDAGGRSTGYQYDQISRLTYINYPDGSGTGLSYQDAQNAVEVTDGNGNATKYKYDGLGNLTEVTEADGAKTEYSYDSLGDIFGVKDPRNLVTAYTYTANGKLSSVKEYDGSTTTFSYDSAGNLKQKSDARGITTSFDYDEMNRLTNKRFSDSKYNVTYNYDEPSSANGMGELTSVVDMNGKTVFSYDTMGRLTKKDQPIDGKTYSVGYEYDQAGNIIKVKDPSNGATSYSVDGLGRITEVKRSTSNGDQVIADYVYNPAGTIANISFFNGTKSDYLYDNRDRIKRLKVTDPQGNILVQQNLGYDSVGNRTSLTSKNEESVQYEYDDLNRLTKVTYPKDMEEFHYDNSGNRTSLSHAFGKMDYAYDPASNKLLTMKINGQGKVNYSYDGDGNLVKEEKYKGDMLDNTINYKYDPENQLIEIEKPIQKVPGVDMPDIQSDKADYIYDSSGMRIKKTTRNGGTKYIYDIADEVICESNQNGDITSSYVYANGKKIAVLKQDGTIQIFHNDSLGSPILITDKDLKEVQRYIYEPFGNLVASKGAGENNYTFTGKERDIESSLFYFGARYYCPILGRYISKDVVRPDYENPQTLNRYEYCLNNPLVYLDPDGKDELYYRERDAVDLFGYKAGHVGKYFTDPMGGWWQVDLSAKYGWRALYGPGLYDARPALDFNLTDEITKRGQDNVIYIKTNTNQDQSMFNFTMGRKSRFDSGQEYYTLLNNNCRKDLYLGALSIGITFPDSSNPVPNTYFDNLRSSIDAFGSLPLSWTFDLSYQNMWAGNNYNWPTLDAGNL